MSPRQDPYAPNRLSYNSRRSAGGTAWAVDEMVHPVDRETYPRDCLIVVRSKTDAIDIASNLDSAFQKGRLFGAYEAAQKEKVTSFTNQETHLVYDWLISDDIGYAKEMWEHTKSCAIVGEFLPYYARLLKSYVEDSTKLTCTKTLSTSLLNQALTRVDWVNLAEYLSTEFEG